MPFEKTIKTSNGTIGIWQLNDSLNELLSLAVLSATDEEKFKSFTAERRKKEFLAARILLQHLSTEKLQIEYATSGKPSIENRNTNISISHSADFVCVYISEKNIGIDVEQTTRNINRVAKRFLHSEEQKYISKLKNQQEAKILYWAAKEAIFKCTNNAGIEFNEQIIIEPFGISKQGSFNGKLHLPNKTVNFQLNYLLLKNNAIVYCVEE